MLGQLDRHRGRNPEAVAGVILVLADAAIDAWLRPG